MGVRSTADGNRTKRTNYYTERADGISKTHTKLTQTPTNSHNFTAPPPSFGPVMAALGARRARRDQHEVAAGRVAPAAAEGGRHRHFDKNEQQWQQEHCVHPKQPIPANSSVE